MSKMEESMREMEEFFKLVNPSSKIYPLIPDFQDTDKQNILEYNIQELRGWVIDQLNYIEQKVDTIIVNFFNPEKKSEFKNILLNTAVISTGSKMKILKNIDSFTNSDISKIQKITSIRNAFAHIPATQSATIIVQKINEKEEVKIIVENVFAQLAVMNSSGEIKTRNIKELIIEFQKLVEEINTSLNLIMKTKEISVDDISDNEFAESVKKKL